MDAIDGKAEVQKTRVKSTLSLGVGIAGLAVASFIAVAGLTYQNPYTGPDDIQIDQPKLTEITKDCFAAQTPADLTQSGPGQIPYRFDQQDFNTCFLEQEQIAQEAAFAAAEVEGRDSISSSITIGLLSAAMAGAGGLGLRRSRSKLDEAEEELQDALNAMPTPEPPPQPSA